MRGLCLLIVLVLAALPAMGEVVQLVPAGETTITLQPGSPRALVRETRTLQLPAGDSALSFSWAKANVDASSVGLALSAGTVGEAVRPAGQDRTMVWQVSVPQAGPVEATVNYFLDGAKWQPAYVLVLDAARNTATLEGHLQVSNETGEPWQNVRLQVGTPGTALADQPEGLAPLAGPPATATVAPGETATVCFTRIPDIPAAVRHVYQAERYGASVRQLLRLGLPEAGVAAVNLPDGPMVIQEAGDLQAPIFKTTLDLQPGKQFEVDMGPEPDIIVERKLVSSQRSNFDMDRFGRVTGMDTTEQWELTALNHLDRPVTLEVVETVLSTWDLKGLDPAERETSWAQWDLPLPAGGEGDLKFTLVKHSGTRVKK